MATKHERPRLMEYCVTCGKTFQFGPGVYDGKHIARYQAMVCRTCYEGNWDGWHRTARPGFFLPGSEEHSYSGAEREGMASSRLIRTVDPSSPYLSLAVAFGRNLFQLGVALL